MTAPVLEICEVSKDYRGLRPLRIAQLTVHIGDRVALLGLDAPSAEVFVNLVTGASLPDSGEIRIFGRATSAIADSADWLATIDRVGIVSARAVLLDQLTVIQNLAMPFTLDIEPPPDAPRRAAESLASEVGLPESAWNGPVAALDAPGRLGVRLGRALALNPSILMLEHATAECGAADASAIGKGIRMMAERRGLALVAATADRSFARAVASRVLTLEAASGCLKEESSRRWFGRLG